MPRSVRWLTLAPIIPLALLLAGCAAPADQAPGVCSLSCDTAKIAGSDGRIRLLGLEEGEALTINCKGIAADNKYYRPIPVRFVYEKISASAAPAAPAGGGEGGGGEGGGGAGAGAAAAPQLNYQPQGGISFEALVLTGSLSKDQPGTDFIDPPSAHHEGILTPVDQWCTDKCGVGAINVQPICQDSAQQITVLLKSGSVAQALKIQVVNE